MNVAKTAEVKCVDIKDLHEYFSNLKTHSTDYLSQVKEIGTKVVEKKPGGMMYLLGRCEGIQDTLIAQISAYDDVLQKIEGMMVVENATVEKGE